MKRYILGTIVVFALVFLSGSASWALLDQFEGDSAIYSATSQYLRPNVLLIIDNSNAAANTAAGVAYDPSIIYRDQPGNPQLYDTYDIWQAGQQGEFTHKETDNTTSSLENLGCTANGSIIRTTLLAAGTYTGRGNSSYPSIKNGDCDNNKAYTYALGNYLNYLNQPPPTDETESQSQIVFDAVSTVVAGSRYAVNFGSMVYNDSGNKGGRVVTPISDLSDDTAFQSFLDKLPGSGSPDAAGLLSSQTSRPQAEALLDAGYYFRGLSLPVSGGSAMASPISNTCDKNIIILITNGLSNKDDDGELSNIVGDYDGDGAEASAYGLGTHYLDDVAKYLYETDNNSSLDGVQRIQTYTILAFQNSDPLVEQTANPSHGRGAYKNVANANELSDALTKMLANIVLEADTSFVAPVVPTSPENRTYSGERVYLGFFKPISQKPWHGNLKKFAIDYQNNIIDKNGDPATLSDGSFSASATSYWSTAADAGSVEEGGAGELLLSRNFTTDPRQIYTNRGESSDLTAASNAFNNTNLSAADLGVADDTARDQLINYIYGYDSYDENGNGNTSEKREWILGDILHSKPQILNYNTYTFNAANESDTDINKTVIFVGTNDGMLHAFRDADGKELWAYIPDNLLPNLQEMGKTPALHTYFVDSSPMAYIFDYDHDGNIGPSEAADGDADDGSHDKVILIFGERRGGNAYYALDVTNPLQPRLLWNVHGNSTYMATDATSGFGRLGETWSEPQLGKMQIGSAEKLVAFVGGGYDPYEDSRYGYYTGVSPNLYYTYKFPSTYAVPVTGEGNVSSTDTYFPSSIPEGAGYHTIGRAVYAIEVADLSSGTPDLTSSGTLLKTFLPVDSAWSSYAYGFASDIAVLDTDYDGFVDRLYVGNLGGQMWRFNVGNHDSSAWTQKMIFWDYTGAKFFYRPSVTYESGYTFLFFGTGDREHPLNTSVRNRFFGFKDRGSFKWYSDLYDATTNVLQGSDTNSTTITSILGTLSASTNAGWYITLNEHHGEKVLASPLAFNKVAYFTTYAPNTEVSEDPCSPGNLGVSRLYAVNYKTGEAVLNFNEGDDGTVADVANSRAINTQGKVLLRSDRSVSLGVGIPSGLVVIMPPSGDAKLLIGCGGGLCSEDPVVGGTIIPIYWMQW